MSAATLPLSSTLPLSPSPRSAPPWEPSDKDRLIFKWVKFLLVPKLCLDTPIPKLRFKSTELDGELSPAS